MGLFRKSKKVGPFRINFSSSSVSVSAGIKGARVNFGPQGTYVHLGSKGVYYRKKIVPLSKDKVSDVVQEQSLKDNFHSITSLNFDTLTDSDSREFISELEKKDRKISFLPIFGIVPSILIMLFFAGWVNEVIATEEVTVNVFKVTSKIVNLRETPTTESQISSQVKNGEVLLIIDSSDAQWFKVLTAKQDTAYVYSTLGTVENESKESEIKRFDKIPWIRPVLGTILLLVLITWILYMRKIDFKRKSLELYYAMEEEFEEAYNLLIEYFDSFSKSRRVWQKLHSEKVDDTKYTGGASNLVNRISVKKIERDSNPTEFLITNVQIPHIKLKKTSLFFFPERLVLKRGNKFASVFYKNLRVSCDNVGFVESEGVPSDAEIIDHTWQYVNKSGGPDRRFKNNRKLPVCLYSEYHFQSSGGVNEIISTSKKGAMSNLAKIINLLGKLQNKID